MPKTLPTRMRNPETPGSSESFGWMVMSAFLAMVKGQIGKAVKPCCLMTFSASASASSKSRVLLTSLLPFLALPVFFRKHFCDVSDGLLVLRGHSREIAEQPFRDRTSALWLCLAPKQEVDGHRQGVRQALEVLERRG